MIIQLSSGMGPAECELAVARLYEKLQSECGDISLLHCVSGKKPGTFQSLLFQTNKDLSALEGSVLWICPSIYRPGHKRKNWYVDVSIMENLKSTRQDRSDSDIKIETFRSGGKGGQHVNKVETGVRVIHLPTGTAVVSTEARSQHRNKQVALNRLCNILAQMDTEKEQMQKQLAWAEHARIVRGNPVRIYEGIKFNPRP